VPIWFILTSTALATPSSDSLPKPGRTRHKRSSPINCTWERGVGQELPSRPVVFGDTILDGDEGIALAPSGKSFHHSSASRLHAFRHHAVAAAGVEMAGSDVNGNGRVLTRLRPARSIASTINSKPCSLVFEGGRRTHPHRPRRGEIRRGISARPSWRGRLPPPSRKSFRIAPGAQRDHLVVLKINVPAPVNSSAHNVDHGMGSSVAVTPPR